MPNNKKHFPWSYFQGRPGVLNIEVHEPIGVKELEKFDVKNLNTKTYNIIFDKLTEYES